MTVPLITDWHFYALAVPCVIMLGISKSGFGAGFGALCVPLLAMVVTVPEAAALLMPVLLLMDLLSMAAFRKDYDRALLRFLIPCALVGVLIGTALFKWLDPRLVAGIVGVVTLLFLAQRLLFPLRADAPPPPRWLGAILVAISGFTSFIAHAGSPPLSPPHSMSSSNPSPNPLYIWSPPNGTMLPRGSAYSTPGSVVGVPS